MKVHFIVVVFIAFCALANGCGHAEGTAPGGSGPLPSLSAKCNGVNCMSN